MVFDEKIIIVCDKKDIEYVIERATSRIIMVVKYNGGEILVGDKEIGIVAINKPIPHNNYNTIITVTCNKKDMKNVMKKLASRYKTGEVRKNDGKIIGFVTEK